MNETATPPLALPRAALFDWDSTLVDNWPTLTHAMNAALAAMGQPSWTEDEMRRRAKASLRDTFPKLFGDRWEDARDVFYQAFEDTHLALLRPPDGAAELLDALAARGVVLGVVSNKVGRYLRREAEHLGWAGRFHRILGATDAPADKPAADVVHAALAGSGFAAGPDVWLVGDSAIDMQCAHAAGCVPLLVETSWIDEAELAKWPPITRFSSCRAVIPRISH